MSPSFRSNLDTSVSNELVPEAEATSNQDETVREREGSPKAWAIGDPFQYSPPKPEGDPWLSLLKPLLDKDRMRCDAWKDEVQNLLIFAGLFSAVVTAFIIESYKNLQPDPNDAMINLLTQIAAGAQGTSSRNSTFTDHFIMQGQFSPGSSAIRVNNFWLISLVLSLAAVLVGIISLQWLREHQSYPAGLTPRQRYAVYHMRNDGIEKWHVHTIFAALPLLLQCALILFLSGLVDFLHSLGEIKVTIPVTIIVAFVLAFLVSTTVLPGLQGLSLYFSPSESGRSDGWRDPISQCPYKSPQSYATRKLLRPLFRLIFRHYQEIRKYYHESSLRKIWPFSQRDAASLPEDNFSRYIYFAYKRTVGIDFDLEWLVIRDAYMRSALGRSSRYEELGQGDDDILPIYDIVQGLQDQCYYRSTYSATYYCISEISELTLLPLDTSDLCYHTAEDRCRQNAYLHDLLRQMNDTGLSDYFLLDPFFHDSHSSPKDTKTLGSILHQQVLFSFLRDDHRNDDVSQSMHRKELALRLMEYFFQGSNVQLGLSGKETSFPRCLAFDQFFFRLDRDMNKDNFDAIAWQFANATLSLFQQVNNNAHPNSVVRSVEVQEGALSLHMETASCLTARAFLPDANGISSTVDQNIKNVFHSLFAYTEEQLNTEMASWESGQTHPSLLFYISALYVYHLVLWEDSRFRSLYSTLCIYKSRTIDLGIADSLVEDRLTKDYRSTPWNFSSCTTPFSNQWWTDFNPR